MKRWLWVAAALCLAVLFGFAAHRVTERGRFALPYSTLGGGPDGTLALFRLTRELGYEPRAHMRELSHMRSPGTLVAIGSCRAGLVRELSRPEREALVSWVERGGLLIVAGVASYLPSEAGLSDEFAATCKDPLEQGFFEGALAGEEDEGISSDEVRVPFYVEAYPSGPPLAHVLPFGVTRASTVQSNGEMEPTVLIESEHGPLAMTAPLGRGRVVYLGIPDAFTNENLAQGGGVVFARLLEAFAPKGPVWFDEYHLGVGARRSLFRYLRDLGYGPVLLQLGLVILAALVAGATRLGEPRDEPREKPRSTRSYLAALGSLYARTRDKQGALEVLGQRALERIARHYRVGNVPLSELQSALSAQGHRAVATYVERVRAHAKRPLAQGEALEARARAIDEDTTAALSLSELA